MQWLTVVLIIIILYLNLSRWWKNRQLKANALYWKWIRWSLQLLLTKKKNRSNKIEMLKSKIKWLNKDRLTDLFFLNSNRNMISWEINSSKKRNRRILYFTTRKNSKLNFLIAMSNTIKNKLWDSEIKLKNISWKMKKTNTSFLWQKTVEKIFKRHQRSSKKNSSRH